MLIALIISIILLIIAKAEHFDQKFENDTNAIVRYLTRGDGTGMAYEWLRRLVDTHGHRMVGSIALESAINDVVTRLKADGFDNVHTEEVPNLPYWIRGDDLVELIEPRLLQFNVLAIGGTEPANLTAEAVVIRDFQDLQNVNVTGKIVVTAQRWRGYTNTVKYRQSAKMFASLGAVGVLVKSIAPFSIHSPHAGKGAQGSDIPVLSITMEDADMLDRMYRNGKHIVIRIVTKSRTVSTAVSRNIIFDITGTESPSEVVLLSAHLDSWDVGQGALDDGGGCAAIWNALFALKQLRKLQLLPAPKRTIRGVFWTAEEQGYLGAKYYYETHKNATNETFYFVAETDQGAFKPRQWNSYLMFSGTSQQMERMSEIVRLLNNEGILLDVQSSKNQGDVQFWSRDGVPATNYMADRGVDHYFYFHHTSGDYLSIFEDGDLEFTAAIFATLGHTIASMDSWQTQPTDTESTERISRLLNGVSARP